MASDLPLPLFVFLFLVLLPTPCSSWRPADDDDASVSRSVFPMDGDVAWVVQVSDLHISTYNPERAAELALLGTALRAIRPHLLLVTSDITVSKQLWRYHEIRTTEDHKSSFWEWELGDWKDSRLMRILAIDGGAVSFIDHTLKQALQTSILITYPTDSRSMNMLDSEKWSMRNDINVLIFSDQVIRNVSARVFDSHSEFKIVEEIPLQLVASTSVHRPLFHAKWNAENYRSSSATRYWLQVFVLDSHGVKISSEQRPFSVEGKMAIPTSSWTNYLLFEVQWEDMYQVLLWSNLVFTIVLLFIPKLLYHFVRRSSSYQRWAVSILSSPIQQRKAYFWLVWFLMEDTRSKPFWFSMKKAIVFLWHRRRIVYSADTANMHAESSSLLPVAPRALLMKFTDKMVSMMIQFCGSWTRRALLLTCLITAAIHLKLCSKLMSAYGMVPVALSPPLAWIPLLLLGGAAYCTVLHVD
ncbi:unnamed protein product [Miscanthus lutarioriparius]|uniref:Uncharacterized protein n=1 Tax=Miscanthus lutarioriparius TaxID=422564 RepID=A0A811MDP4_9POAL|nr:unnamed protein product [Miscanthus lutarioriparius]